MQNEFNYFTEIEERFQQRRGTLLLLSTLDWALIESWKEAGVPLEAVLRGIDSAFDKYDRRPAKTRKVNSLAYCSQEVLAAAEDMKEAAVGTTREVHDTGVSARRLSDYLARNAESFARARVPASAAPVAAAHAETLRRLASEIAAAPQVPDLEDLERRMTVMEDKLLAALLAATSDDELVAIRAQADRELAPYRGKMSGPQIDTLLKQYTNKKLLERYALPRLSLFYM
ncbi:MAG TPA: hypothetical protein VEG32_06965 [Clostridia bacterium]|nr:hypothetical protein [Clostridia bacterium]